jgi:antirestriction protein ArdC
MKTSKPNFRQEVTNEVIEMIEAGTAPWIRPWQTGEIAAAFNPTTNMPYRGGNTIALMCASLRKGIHRSTVDDLSPSRWEGLAGPQR